MPTKNGQASLVIIIFFSIIFTIMMGLGIFKLPPQFTLVFLFASIIFVIALIKTDIALIILILSMLLSPELRLGGITGRGVVLRADDIFLLTVFFGWLAKMAINKEIGLLRFTPLNRPIFGYVFVCLIATGLGVVQGYSNPKESVFYLLKYFEYFLLYFMVVNNIKDIRQAKMFVFFILLTCFLVSAYAWLRHPIEGGRASAPFEGPAGESNTFAGYLLLMIAVVIGQLLYFNSQKQRLLLSGLLVFIIAPFLWTLSRGAWLGLFPMVITLIILTKKGRPVLLVTLMIFTVLSPVLLSEAVHERIKSTFIPGEYYTVFGKRVAFDESGVARIESWKVSIEKWYKRPLLGYGVPGFGVVGDSQYVRVLREVGIIGFIVFIWLMVMIFRVGWQSYNAVEGNNFAQGLSLGFIAGFTGLLTQALTAETFIIIRIMEPFWFLAAIVVMLPEISAQPQTANIR